MRGKDKVKKSEDVNEGITPAYAGKSVFSAPWGWTGEDHPRLCGEKLEDTDKEFQRRGSPPPMRGKAYLRSS